MVTCADSARTDEVEVSAVMPCLSEELTIGTCIRKAQRCFAAMGMRGEVVVADNGSTDRSVSIAEQLGARVVREETPGYGAALRRGIEEAHGSIVIIADSDDSYDWQDLAVYVSRIRDGYDLVVGDRFSGGIQPGAMPPLHRYLGNPVLSFLARSLYAAPVRDFHCGMRAFTKAAYQKMRVSTTGMEFATEMIANAALQGLKISEVPTKLYPDGRNRAPHLRSFRDGWRHLRLIFTYAPDYLYLLPGGLMLLAGMLLLGLLAAGPIHVGTEYIGIHFLALGCVLALTGFNVCAFGVVAKVLMSKRLPNLRSRVVRWCEKHLTLERGLIAASVPLLSGSAIDTALLLRWLSSSRPMDDTAHLAFVATTLISFGVNGSLISFLLHMMLGDRQQHPGEGAADSLSQLHRNVR